jgi:hypothetical protein
MTSELIAYSASKFVDYENFNGLGILIIFLLID